MVAAISRTMVWRLTSGLSTPVLRHAHRQTGFRPCLWIFFHFIRSGVALTTVYPSNYLTKTFSHLDQYLSMAFAQLTFRESLRDIEVCLRAHEAKLYHLGIRGHVARSNLGDANEKRDWRILSHFREHLDRASAAALRGRCLRR